MIRKLLLVNESRTKFLRQCHMRVCDFGPRDNCCLNFAHGLTQVSFFALPQWAMMDEQGEGNREKAHGGDGSDRNSAPTILCHKKHL
jgi:hypothetical protein